MTGADYDSARRLLGLSVTEAAAFHGVADRSVRYWGVSGPPEGAAAELQQLAALEAAARFDLIDSAISSGGEAQLWRYATADALGAAGGPPLPLGCHAMMVARAAAELRSRGVQVTVEWA